MQVGAFRILQKIFQKLCSLFGKAKSRLYYPAKRGGTTALYLIAGNLKNNVRFKSSVNQCCTMKRATPMKKFVGAEFGRLLF
ncbi:hypothetical protein J0W43_03280, partial [Clostridioides difficile]|nr:hypothetical protein [Clostridioides difficile]